MWMFIAVYLHSDATIQNEKSFNRVVTADDEIWQMAQSQRLGIGWLSSTLTFRVLFLLLCLSLLPLCYCPNCCMILHRSLSQCVTKQSPDQKRENTLSKSKSVFFSLGIYNSYNLQGLHIDHIMKTINENYTI